MVITRCGDWLYLCRRQTLALLNNSIHRKCGYKIMDESKIILNRILDFILRSIASKQNKQLLSRQAFSVVIPLEIGTHLIRCRKDDENVFDFVSVSQLYRKKNIRSWNSWYAHHVKTPTIGYAIVVMLTCRINELSRKIDSLSELNK